MLDNVRALRSGFEAVAFLGLPERAGLADLTGGSGNVRLMITNTHKLTESTVQGLHLFITVPVLIELFSEEFSVNSQPATSVASKVFPADLLFR